MVPSSRRHLLKSALSSLGAAALRPLAALASTADSAQATSTLLSHATAADLLVGSAVVSTEIKSNPQFRSLLSQQQGMLVADWEMKWGPLRPAPNQFSFAAADYLVAYAKLNNQLMRGHNLCWYQALPAWFSGYATTANARSLLSQHIRTVAGRYAGQLHSWDVVNEGINVADGRPDGLRISPWLSLAGSDYIDYAFHVARTADPTALLTYNETGIELDTPDNINKRGYLLELVQGMKARGVPIDAVGIQSHLLAGVNTFGQGLVTFIRQMAALNVQVFLTEMDVSDVNLTGTIAYRDAVVAATYSAYLQLVLPEPNVKLLITWECRDPDSWLQTFSPRGDGQPLRPLPFDANFLPKPAFTAICQAMDTRAAALT